MGERDDVTVGVTSYVHAGWVVEDLDAAVAFLTTLGLECGRPMAVEGEWIDRIIGLAAARVEIVMARAPDGTGEIELVKFHAPAAEPEPGGADARPNRTGIRHIAYQVGDLHAIVDRVRAAGWDTLGEVVDYQGQYLLCYLRGPEGLIVELAEPLRRGAA
jgi:catechol 2,3-dioxygenase-like lactoylglutathione lyase family enzyme